MSKKLSSEQAKQILDEFSGENMETIKATALAEIRGGVYVVGMIPIYDKDGEEVDYKYEVIPWNQPEKIAAAITYIAQNGKNGLDTTYSEDEVKSKTDKPYAYYLLVQRPPNHKFWESLMARYVGKPVEQIKVDSDVRHWQGIAEKATDKAKQEIRSRKESTGEVVTLEDILGGA